LSRANHALRKRPLGGSRSLIGIDQRRDRLSFFGLLFGSGARTRRLRVIAPNLLPVYDFRDLFVVEGLILEQSLSQPDQSISILFEDLLGPGVSLHHDSPNFLIDFNGRVFAVILMLGYFSAQENL